MADTPRLSHDQAEAVGQELACWLQERTQILDQLDELQWADAVQLVLRRARELEQEGESE